MINSKTEVVAAFDFDGTITTKDTLIDFLIFYFGKPRVLLGFIFLSPILVLFKFKLIKNYKAKQILFSYFFKGKNIEKFNNRCRLYTKRIESISRADSLKKIQWHLEQNHTVIIISASIRNWIEPWAKVNGIEEVLATEINIYDNRIIGSFKNKNCYGIEKVNRLLEKYPDKDSYTLYAYGDSRGDQELLNLADYPTFIK